MIFMIFFMSFMLSIFSIPKKLLNEMKNTKDLLCKKKKFSSVYSE